MLRSNAYERACAAFMRRQRVPFLGTLELQRPPGGTETLKNVDFLIAAGACGPLLADVKGRLFPAGKRRQFWRNWVTEDDLSSLAGWEAQWGNGTAGAFVFAFRLVEEVSPVPPELLFEFEGAWYAFLTVARADYAAHCRPLSPRWRTVTLSATDFRRLAVPLQVRLGLADPVGLAAE